MLRADDGVRFYWQGTLVLDRWESCCEDVAITLPMVEGNYYDVRVEFKEYQEEAYIQLFWTSLSIPKEIIPAKYLYYPKRVASSPYNIEITKGPSIADQTTSYGGGLTDAVVGKLHEIYIQSRNEIGGIIDNTDDHYELHFAGPDGTSTGDFYKTGVYQSNGLYLVQYVPQIAGKYVLTITLLGKPIKNSPFSVNIIPGEVAPTNCITTLGLAPLSVRAGVTKFFTVTTYDLFNNLQVQSYADTDVAIFAAYVNHNAYASPISVPDLPNWSFIHGKDISGIALDKGDGTYASQFTIFRAGTYALSIKINDVHVKQSPYQQPQSDYLYITPSEIYAPNCIVKQVVLDYVAGTMSQFDIQGRDFYSNNIVSLLASAITDHKVEFRSSDSSNQVILSGILTDAVQGAGAFNLKFTPTIAGHFLMHIVFNGLEVDNSPYKVTVTPATTTSGAKSTIVNINRMDFVTGETITFIIESRDAFSNLRTTSVSDVYVVTLTGATSGTVWTASTPVANNNGTYSAHFKFTIAEDYTLRVRLNGVDLFGTPISDIAVRVGPAQAKHSLLVSSQSPLVAGTNYTFKIQAKDIYSNIAVAVNDVPEMFDFELIGLDDPYNSGELVKADIKYLFGLYEATFQLGLIGSYSGVIRLLQSGGLRATYYKTIDFQAPVYLLSTYEHNGLQYTQVDSKIDFNFP